MDIAANIKYLKGVGEKRAAMLGKLGVHTLGDLLTLYPRAYEDWSSVIPIAGAPLGENVCIRAFVGSRCREHRIRKGMTLYKTEISDGESLLEVTFFNNKYAAERLEAGKEYLFFGKVTGKGYFRSMVSPEFAEFDGGTGLRPIYPQTAGLNSRAIEKLVRRALEECGDIEDPIPENIRSAYCLMDLRDALEHIHAPQSADMLSEARRRLIFEELFLLELGLMRLKSKNRKGTAIAMERDYTADFIAALPFELTGAQRRAVAQGAEDMSRSVPMNRLLQGDVGSGKTAVGAALIYNCAMNGCQSALMAPTEVLAMQHYKTLTKFFENTDISVALLTGSTPAAEKRRIKAGLKSGEISLVIGTHALIQKDVEFNSLALAITDEQHRFGVEQRARMMDKGFHPHVLVMSATPIPRTLALMLYGDLELSAVDEMPPGRLTVKTHLVSQNKRAELIRYLGNEAAMDHRSYVVCPLIEKTEGYEGLSVEEVAEEFANALPGVSIGCLHGRMEEQEKQCVMEAFRKGEISILIATTVIEVGIHVPEALHMTIIGAERFGLSSLHQLRGRVGRGEGQAHCFLLCTKVQQNSMARLQAMLDTNDGFEIANRDMALRGTGDLLGIRQSGESRLEAFLREGSLALVEKAHAAAREIMREPYEAYNELLKESNRRYGQGRRIALN